MIEQKNFAKKNFDENINKPSVIQRLNIITTLFEFNSKFLAI